MRTFVYYCITRLCREYRREFRAPVGPAEARADTGRSMSCAHCGQPVRLVRIELREVA